MSQQSSEGGNPEASRREKLNRWRDDLGINPYGHRVDDIMSLADARAAFDQAAHDAFEAAEDGADDPRPRVRVSGRCIQHREMGKLAFLVLRDHTGDLQVSCSKAALEPDQFKLARKLDYGDIVVVEGPMGMTRRGEICVWADRFEVHCKSLAPPPEKFHGLTDAELRYRQRYVDMYANPETIQLFQKRSRMVSAIRRHMDDRGFLEVETPIMQSLAGGAAARPFTTHHNALDIPLFLRIAPELYLKRLLVGGMPRVYEIGRNFRNEGVDRSHNPEFTMFEVYEAFGDCWTMLELTEDVLVMLVDLVGEGETTLPYGDVNVDWSRPFERRTYGDIFESALGYSMEDEARVRATAAELKLDGAQTKDHWLLVSEIYEAKAEDTVDPTRPTFVTDYPSAISPLTRPHADAPHLCGRWELLIAGMEVANSYTELNDPDVQLQRFTEQLAGADEEEQAFRVLDEDFINALKVGMPPAGGLGIGIDRIIMLMTNSRSIRDVVLFPLMRPEE